MNDTMRACGKIKPRESLYEYRPRIGGPRDVCMKPRGHEGSCGEWTRMTDAEHGDVLAGRRALELPVFDRGHVVPRHFHFAELDFAQ